MHYNFVMSETVMDVPPAYSPDVSLEEEEKDETVLALLGKQVRECVETWTREQRAPTCWSSHSQNDRTSSRLSPNWRSHSCSKLVWRLQVKNRSSCLLSAKMKRWGPHLPLIQIGQRATGTMPGRPGYMRAGSLVHREGTYQLCLFSSAKRNGCCWNGVCDFLLQDCCFSCFAFKSMFNFGPMVCALTCCLGSWTNSSLWNFCFVKHLCSGFCLVNQSYLQILWKLWPTIFIPFDSWLCWLKMLNRSCSPKHLEGWRWAMVRQANNYCGIHMHSKCNVSS